MLLTTGTTKGKRDKGDNVLKIGKSYFTQVTKTIFETKNSPKSWVFLQIWTIFTIFTC